MAFWALREIVVTPNTANLSAKIETTVQRVVRDSLLIKQLKKSTTTHVKSATFN